MKSTAIPGAKCPADWERTLEGDRDLALEMLKAAANELRVNPDDQRVQEVVSKEFHVVRSVYYRILAWHLDRLAAALPSASFMCSDFAGTPGGTLRCQSETISAWAMWCVPGFWIRLCPPYWSYSASAERAQILIHELAHKYLCRLDLGYGFQPGYETHSPLRAFLNAEAWCRLSARLWAIRGKVGASDWS